MYVVQHCRIKQFEYLLEIVILWISYFLMEKMIARRNQKKTGTGITSIADQLLSLTYYVIDRS